MATANACTSSATLDAISEDLLETLIQYVEPIFYDRVHSSSILSPGNIGNQVAGQKFIANLKALILSVTSAQSTGQSGTGDENVERNLQDESTTGGIPDESIAAPEPAAHLCLLDDMSDVQPVLLKHITSTELEVVTLTKVRAHVFNKMPIRLLAFDEAGCDVQLIERDEIFSRILPRVYSEITSAQFQSDWAKAQELRDVFIHWKHRQNAMDNLFSKAIERSVHYAILSHTWIRETPGDVVYKDWKVRMGNQRGYAKISRFCEVAARDHVITLGWIDTVCINKDSSAELDESIRSMYNWYRGARVCITYLSETVQIDDDRLDSWFGRGWTLQELLAPLKNVFYNVSWEALGSSDDAAVESFIETATTITKKELDLCRSGEIERIPISRRMQLACGRQVTREEDKSYSLMGILGVDISIAYGEGSQHAFNRLIRELMSSKRHILDIFNRDYDDSNKLIPSSLELYASRDAYFDTSDYISGTSWDQYKPFKPIILTHLGVRVPLLLAPVLLSRKEFDPDYVPHGGLSGRYPVCFTLNNSSKLDAFYNLLDSRLYTGNLAFLPEIASTTLGPTDIFRNVGIFNFGVDNLGNVIIPHWCAAFSFYWKGMMPGKMTDFLEEINISPGRQPVFHLESSNDVYTIPKSELAGHGLRLVTLYL